MSDYTMVISMKPKGRRENQGLIHLSVFQLSRDGGRSYSSHWQGQRERNKEEMKSNRDNYETLLNDGIAGWLMLDVGGGVQGGETAKGEWNWLMVSNWGGGCGKLWCRLGSVWEISDQQIKCSGRKRGANFEFDQLAQVSDSSFHPIMLQLLGILISILFTPFSYQMNHTRLHYGPKLHFTLLCKTHLRRTRWVGRSHGICTRQKLAITLRSSKSSIWITIPTLMPSP